ncbi:MAG: S8 family serine peptidase [Patescibacteria group bacterium]|nr:S8 family serine peptidase [Patescibacteria group bacterium]
MRLDGRFKILKKLFKATGSFLLLTLFFALAPQAGVLAQTQPAKYLAQLTSGDSAILLKLGSNVSREFLFANDPRFSNIFSFSSSLGLAELRDQLGAQAKFVQTDSSFQLADTVVTTPEAATGLGIQPISVNDPGFTSNAANIDKQWYIPKVGFDSAWTKTTGNFSNVVAVVDTGVDMTHEDLQKINLANGFNFIAQQPIVGHVNSDDNGHGTLVAGILGASANNGRGIVGTNWSMSLMPLKALDSTGRGDSSSVAQAIVWATDHGANFINLSLGGIGFSRDTVLANAVDYAFKKNVLIIAAAGNDTAANGENLDQQPVYPVCDDNGANEIIGVAAVDQNDLKADFSNYGKNCIDVTAPGKRILSTINYDPLTKTYSPNAYAYVSGTSIAVPLVVGEAMLVKSLNPAATNVQLRDQVLSTSDSVDNLNLVQCGGASCWSLIGAGRINAWQAVNQKISSSTSTLAEGALVTAGPGLPVFLIISGQKRQVSQFVQQQRFRLQGVKVVSGTALYSMPDGPYVAPLDGTLVKSALSPTVYYISLGQKMPVSYTVFNQRHYNFNQVATLSDAELNSWLASSLLPPSEGTLVKTASSATVYWVVGGSLHPINWNFYTQRGLNVFPIMLAPRQELTSYPQGEAYIR